MYQETAGQRFVSFPTAAQEFLFTATREHSKYTSLKWKFDAAMEAAVDGDMPECKLVKPLTNFFWSGTDRHNVSAFKQAAKIERGAEAKRKTDDARTRKQAERRKIKASLTKERKATKPRVRRKNVRQRAAGSDEDSTEEDGNAPGKPCFRTCSDTA